MRTSLLTLVAAMAMLFAQTAMAIRVQAMSLGVSVNIRAAIEETSLTEQIRIVCHRYCDRRGCRQVCQQSRYWRQRQPLDPTTRPLPQPWWERK